MNTLVIAGLTVLSAALLAAYHVHNVMDRRRLNLRVQKLYGSQLFEDLKPVLRAIRHYRVEELTLDKTGLTWSYYQRWGEKSSFLMHSHGYDYLDSHQQLAMRVLLEEYIPGLKDPHCYHLKHRRQVLLNGTVEYVDSYVMTSSYKASLSRFAYYDGTL